MSIRSRTTISRGGRKAAIVGQFDTKSYLAAYPDVAAAHVDPLAHFSTPACQEGRSAFADGHSDSGAAANASGSRIWVTRPASGLGVACALFIIDARNA